MKKSIFILAILTLFSIGCKKEPMYMDKPSPDIYRIKSLTNGLLIYLYEPNVISGFQIDKGKTKEYEVAEYYKVRVECPNGGCTYYFNGIKHKESREFSKTDSR